MSPPGPRSVPAPKMGDIPGPADLARRTDRMDSFDMRLGRVEAKLDHLIVIFEKTLTPSKAKR
jgi:hypothetical protein